ncbi:hypothetical protein N7532_003584 [Penicillium argentinense]|uniref:DNA-directed RNA polymerase subunit n=1 Tax=Penicillium argentinense TaxID=1131581 RepID=A0A9W9FNA3_9EURO|nr:uncharacterized protein N7532_003584 [Penicillium argentinense]KAJ5103055.1 hypothetical protein N7532_003584 [Penicillium argentinense]
MSSSPAPSDAGEARQPDQIHFRFCRECSNLLYPKEAKHGNQLLFTCRTCHVGEPASSPCVYQNKLNNQVGDTAGVTTDVATDPTVCDTVFLKLSQFGFVVMPGLCTFCGGAILCSLPRANKLCPSCGESEAVFFQSQQRSADTGMKLYYVCCACANVFL